MPQGKYPLLVLGCMHFPYGQVNTLSFYKHMDSVNSHFSFSTKELAHGGWWSLEEFVDTEKIEIR